jgi:plasmid stabilization system protein ParE
MDAVWDGVYEASRNFDVADRYVSEFVDEIEAKKLFPLSGIPLQYRGLFTGYYSVNFKKYKAFYRVRDGYVEVARIIMTKSNYMKILFDEPEDGADTL